MDKSYIEIYRSPIYAGAFRSYPVIIDGKKIAKIKHDERLRLEIVPGHHSIQTGIDFIKSNLLNFEVKKGQKISLNIDRKYISFRKKFFNLFIFSMLITIGSFFGFIGSGLGAGVGSFFLIEVIAKPHIYYIDLENIKT